MFNIFGRSRRTGPRGPRGPRGTVRPADLDYLRQWTATHRGVEAYVEPETLVNEMSVVLVDEAGEWTRRRIGGPKGVDVIIDELGVRVYDAASSGYPQRMRDRIERDRIIRQRLEARERRARFEERSREDSDD
ncbi:MAG TPA: oxidoreductase [Candidatus Corynebacterium avicola]|uniref:Oxidoreductase n=1 Tax=Candidatus Corynebacterium avicola TaxID=2838527 RepID=A0A9D1RS79_9CORY|nr:oxidoreductase [Candidatus Corynebacterium avicola]